jgi:pimeloyl-ACP methyl ester carboxylesterase
VNAPRWLLLHGVPLSAQVWDGVRHHLRGEALAPELTDAIAAAPPDGVLQQHVAAAALAAVPEGELVVVGHSFGGQVALETALLAPQRIRGLIVVCSRHTPFPAFAAGARAVAAGDPVDIDAGLRRWFRPAELAADGPAVRYARQRVRCAPRRPWAAALAAIATYDRSAEVRAIGMPAALFGAGHDQVSPPAAMAELAAELPHARFEIVDGWAHMSAFVDPAAFAARLTAAAPHG